MKTNPFYVAFLMLLFATSLWASNTQVDGIWYDFYSSTHTATVTFRGVQYNSYRGEYSGQVTIPSVVNYNNESYSVTSIGDDAFWGCSGLTSVTIPNSVTSIGDWAFNDCSGLTRVTLPNSVTSIGYKAFYDCSGLTKITIPTSVTSIGEFAFSGCNNITSVIWNAKNCSDFSISEYAPFNYISSQITSLTFGEEVEHIPAHLCSTMSNLTSVTIPNSVTSIGDWAFNDCSGLTRVTLSNSITSILDYAFNGCSGLTSVTIPYTVTSIGNCAFRGCSTLTSVSIPDSVRSIGESAFENCSGLTSITIGKNVKNIGALVLKGCTNLTNVLWKASHIDFSENNNPFYYYEDQYSLKNYDIRQQITSFTFDKDVTKIPAFLCKGMRNLTSINIPNRVTNIGVSAFRGCGFSSIIIPDNVKEIHSYAFAECLNLRSVEIPNSVIGIREGAFSECCYLNSVTIGKGVRSIGTCAFMHCNNLKNVYWNAINCIGFSDKVNPFYVIGNPSTTNYDLRSNIESFIFGNEVKTIPDYLCYNFRNSTISPLPSSVTEIGRGAFKYSRLISDSIFFSNNVEKIGREAFFGAGLTFIVLGENVSEIGEGAFTTTYSGASVIVQGETPAEIRTNSFWGDSYCLKIFVPCGLLNTYREAAGWRSYSANIQYMPTNISVVSSDETKGTVSYPETLCDAPQILAIPNEGYHFTKWNDGNTNNPRTIDPSEEKTYTASFEINKYQVRFFGFNNVLLSEQSVAHGASAIAPEAPQVEHYDFVGWDKEYTNVTSNLDVYAIYEKNTEDVDNINFNTQPRKIVVDGQTLILRGDRLYTLQGQEVK